MLELMELMLELMLELMMELVLEWMLELMELMPELERWRGTTAAGGSQFYRANILDLSSAVFLQRMGRVLRIGGRVS